MAIKVGDILSDNDPRSKGRLLYVRKVDGRYVYAAVRAMGYRLTRVLLNRVYEDDKPRRTGYSVVKTAPTSAST